MESKPPAPIFNDIARHGHGGEKLLGIVEVGSTPVCLWNRAWGKDGPPRILVDGNIVLLCCQHTEIVRIREIMNQPKHPILSLCGLCMRPSGQFERRPLEIIFGRLRCFLDAELAITEFRELQG